MIQIEWLDIVADNMMKVRRPGPLPDPCCVLISKVLGRLR